MTVRQEPGFIFLLELNLLFCLPSSVHSEAVLDIDVAVGIIGGITILLLLCSFTLLVQIIFIQYKRCKSRRCKVRSKDLDKSINLQDQQGKSEGKVDNKEPLKNSCMSMQFEEDADQDQTNRRDIYQRHKCSEDNGDTMRSSIHGGTDLMLGHFLSDPMTGPKHENPSVAKVKELVVRLSPSSQQSRKSYTRNSCSIHK